MAGGTFAQFRRERNSILADIEDQERVCRRCSELYIHFGIAKGQHHAEQLIRDIESQAAEQAASIPANPVDRDIQPAGVKSRLTR